MANRIDTTQVAEFYKRFPEFCGADEARVKMFLEDAAMLMHSKERWCDPEIYNIALMYLAAHMFFIGEASASGDSGSQFPLKRQEVDDVVIESAVKAVDITTDPLYTTSYGQTYVKYRRLCFGGPIGV